MHHAEMMFAKMDRNSDGVIDDRVAEGLPRITRRKAARGRPDTRTGSRAIPIRFFMEPRAKPLRQAKRKTLAATFRRRAFRPRTGCDHRDPSFQSGEQGEFRFLQGLDGAVVALPAHQERHGTGIDRKPSSQATPGWFNAHSRSTGQGERSRRQWSPSKMSPLLPALGQRSQGARGWADGSGGVRASTAHSKRATSGR